MADTWNARAWVASVLGCSPADLSIRSRHDAYLTGTQVRYDRAGEQVARLIVGGPVRPLDGRSPMASRCPVRVAIHDRRAAEDSE